ncbi:MAG TPA: helix-turn-helix transcriptional regulator [Candidatus Baltobacteraceae bacterium]|nr:helix-turn-helix transcriptional regulator [Candidatus Baltobacteraceae bacterium]
METSAALYARGDLDRAVAALPRGAGAAAHALLAQVELDRGNVAAALRCAQDACAVARDRTEALIGRALRAVASAHLGAKPEDFSAHDLLGVDPEALDEALIVIATASAIGADVASAQGWLSLINTTNPHVLARKLLSQGHLAAATCAFGEQARLATVVVQHLTPHAAQESTLFADAVQTYADFAREMNLATTVDISAVAELAGVCDATRFYALRAQAWLLVLRSEYEAALNVLIRATMYAHKPLAHVASQLDLASAAIACGDAHAPFARAALDVAMAAALRLIWEAESASGVRLVPQLLQVSAEMQCAANRQRIERLAAHIFEDCTTRHSPGIVMRYEALFHEAKAYAYRYDDPKFALSCAEQAYARFEKFQFDWRAGRIALLVYQATGSHEWEGRAKNHLQAYAKSRFFRLLDGGNAQRLTRRQQEVLDGVLAGKSPVQIALHLGIAEDTVRKHLKPIMRHYGVKTRLQLLARHFKDHDATFHRSDVMGSGANP